MEQKKKSSTKSRILITILLISGAILLEVVGAILFCIFSDTETVFDFYGIPVIGTNWYTFYDPDATKYANGFKENGRAQFIKASMDGHRKVKVAYRLCWKDFNTEQWNNLKDEEMWLSVTLSPVEKRIKIISEVVFQ